MTNPRPIRHPEDEYRDLQSKSDVDSGVPRNHIPQNRISLETPGDSCQALGKKARILKSAVSPTA